MGLPYVQQYGDEVRVDRDLSAWQSDKARRRAVVSRHTTC